ncbi:MAG: hypothetical protein J0H68_09405 [Sphingobacteriia bacterium]|nr:hypothetical protein [Sphingobacteriia bacterium]
MNKIPLLLLLSLTACTTYKRDFTCKAKDGLGCLSVSEVHSVIDNGKVNNEEKYIEKKIITEEKLNKTSNSSITSYLPVLIKAHTDHNGNKIEDFYINVPMN